MKIIPCLVLLAAVFTVGCGSDVPDFPDTAVVKGVVTQGGKPVEGATVTFIPKIEGEGAYAASGTTGSDGSYNLSTFFSAASTKEGAIPGDYKVTVTKSPPVDPNAGKGHGDPTAMGPANVLPKQYAEANGSPLDANVKAGKENDVPLELK